MIIKVLQLNCQKKEVSTRSILNRKDADILLLQEPYIISKTKLPITQDNRWIAIFDESSTEKIRAVTYIKKHTRIPSMTTVSKWTNSDMVGIEIGQVTLLNIYNQKNNCPHHEEGVLTFYRGGIGHQMPQKTIIAGDYNLHHQEWQTRTRTSAIARETVEWMRDNDMQLCSPKDVSTQVSGSVIDLVYASADIAGSIEYLTTEERPLEDDMFSDHYLQSWNLHFGEENEGPDYSQTTRGFNTRKADWEAFDRELSFEIEQLNITPAKLKYEWKVDQVAEQLECALRNAMEKAIPRLKIGPWTKRYWTDELTQLKREARLARSIAVRSMLEADRVKAVEAVRKYKEESRKRRRENWNEFLSNLRGTEIWKVLKYLKPRGNQQVMPHLVKDDGSLTRTTLEKRNYLWEKLLPVQHRDDVYPPLVTKDQDWPDLNISEIDDVIYRLPDFKAPGPDQVTGLTLKRAWNNNDFKTRFTEVLSAAVSLGYHPKIWRTGSIVVLKKPGKKNYGVPKAYRPITLLKIPAKVLEKIVQKRLAFLTRDILPAEQYGGRGGYCATDAVLELTDHIKTNKGPTTAMMIDIQGAFDNVDRERLIETMEEYKIPSAAQRWTHHFVSERTATMIIDGAAGEEKRVETGIPQGSPISPLLFLLYTTPLYSKIKEFGAKVSGFVDDITVFISGNIVENAKKMSRILKECCDWAESRSTKIDMSDKLGFIHFRSRMLSRSEIGEAVLTLPDGTTREAQQEVKLLGITLDVRLRFQPHINKVISKAKQAMGIIFRLGGVKTGMTGMAVRCMYLACVRPIIEYGLEVWQHCISATQMQQLETTQNTGLRRILGAVKTTPIEVMEIEAGIPPIDLRISYVSAKKLIRLKYGLCHTNPLRSLVDTRNWDSPLHKIQEHLTDKRFLSETVDTTPSIAPWASLDELEEYRTNLQAHQKKRDEPTKKELKALLDNWQDDYDNGTKGAWYRSIVKNAKCSVRVPKLITNEILKHESRSTLSQITHLRTGHGPVGAWLKRFHIYRDSYNCRCGELETFSHILKVCPLKSRLRESFLRPISEALELSKLLNSRKGLQATVAFLNARDANPTLC